MGRSILVADDSATLRKIVELAFTDTPFHVESVASGAAALAKLRAFRPDVVLAGIDMAEPSGYEICRQVKQSDRPVPVLLLAGTFKPVDDDRVRECGADGFLLKPFESRILLERVDDLISRERAAEAGAEPASEAAPAEVPEDGAVPEVAPATEDRAEPSETVDGGIVLSPETIDALARAVARKISLDVVREVAREMVPRVVEEVIERRIREGEDEGA